LAAAPFYSLQETYKHCEDIFFITVIRLKKLKSVETIYWKGFWLPLLWSPDIYREGSAHTNAVRDSNIIRTTVIFYRYISGYAGEATLFNRKYFSKKVEYVNVNKHAEFPAAAG